MTDAIETAKILREQAARCRRLGKSIWHEDVERRLLEMADEFEERAAALEVSSGAPKKSVACTLGASDHRQRLDWIESLTREALRGHERDDLALRLTYDPEARDRVREMVDKERACCAFLTFDLEESGEILRLIITVPEEARGSANTLFEPFLLR